MFKQLRLSVALYALLAGLGATCAHADEIQDANKLFKQGQLAQAQEKVNAYLSRKPKDPQGRFLNGLIKAEQGQNNEAIRIFSELSTDYPELPEPYNNLAVLYAAQEQYDKAKTALEMAIRTHPSYATAHENLGDIYAKMASIAYNRALQLDSNNTSSQTKLALIKDLFSSKSPKPGTGRDTVVATAPQQPIVVASAQPVAHQPAAPASAASAPTTPAVSTAAVQPAAPITTAELPPVKPVDNGAEMLKTVQEWAAAWSGNNVQKYLSHYAKNFKVPGGESRSSWEQQRHDRIAKPKSIHVTIESAKAQLTGATHGSVTFRQYYRSGTLKTTTLKTLEMVKLDGKWQIIEERTGR